MKKREMVKMIWGVAAALTLAACSREAVTDKPRHNGDGTGALRIAAVTMPQIALNGQTRAEDAPGGTVNIESFMGNAAKTYTEKWANESLRTRVLCVAMDDEALEGIDDHVFDSAVKYNEENPTLTPVPATYNVTLGMANSNNRLYGYKDAETGKEVSGVDAPHYRYANPDAKLIPQVAEGEGASYIYFEGWTQTEVQDEFNQEVTVTVGVANTAVMVEFTEAFKEYFANGATVTLKTDNGFTATINSTDADRYFWVRPWQNITLTAQGKRQNPGTGLTAETVDLGVYSEKEIAPKTLYTFTYDLSTAGGLSGEIKITLNGEIIGEESLDDVETNPNEQ